MYECMYWWMDGSARGWMDGWMDASMDDGAGGGE